MLCEKKDCTGCYSCFNSCPRNAINMIEDRCGYIYPIINEKKCINCKICEKSCPVLNNVKFNFPKKCYAGRVKNDDKLKLATSGGVATQISEYFIENNGIVYGASFEKNCNVNHIRVAEKEKLEKLRGSKYVHSYILDTFKFVREDLEKHKDVLFIGTPCQIAGLKTFLHKEYENLYTVDIICHGVPSQKYLKDEIKRIKKDLDVDRINFRDKKYDFFTFSIKKNDVDVFEESCNKSPYFYTFINSITYRENCYSCAYAKSERCSDLTIGDFWGLNENSMFYDEREKGVSVLLPCTDKGIKLIKNISNSMFLEERSIYEAIHGNDQLMKPVYKSKYVERFKNNYNEDFYRTYKKVMKLNFYKQKIKSNVLVSKILKIKKGITNGKK